MSNATPIKNDNVEIYALLKQELNQDTTKYPDCFESQILTGAVQLACLTRSYQKKLHNGDELLKQLNEDLDNRYNLGKERYNVALQPFNGRDALQDAYEELIDAVFYLRQALYESVNKQAQE